MKTDLIPGIQNPLKNQDLIVQTIAHVTTDIKVIETNKRYRKDTYPDNHKKLFSSVQNVFKKTISLNIINLS